MKEAAFVLLAAVGVRMLLFPAYRSTDFEVHRNWLAITHSLPLREWYFEATSQWTLDYPPFFAAFEWAMSQAAALVDPQLVTVVEDLRDPSAATVAFQRWSVVVSDLMLLFGGWQMTRSWPATHTSEAPAGTFKTRAALLLLMFCPGLLLVDHVHFQYNGFLFGILLWSVACLRRKQDLRGALLFAALLMFKQIFLYVAPLYFVYLLRHFCCPGAPSRRFSPLNLLVLGAGVLAVFALALGPLFAATPAEQHGALLLQLKDRMFPFKRGLCHAYWAPNVWALYSAADRAALLVLKLAGAPLPAAPSTTGGLVHDAAAAVLPTVSPLATVVLAALTMLPMLVSVWRRPYPKAFVTALAYVSFCSFQLGWHVHEKAILLVLVPLAFSALDSAEEARVFLLTSAAGTFSLFPLFFTPQENALKVVLTVATLYGAYLLLDAFIRQSQRDLRIRQEGVSFAPPERAYMAGLLGVYGFSLWGCEAMPFLPLMLTSCYCAVGLGYCWILCYRVHMRKAAAIEQYYDF